MEGTEEKAKLEFLKEFYQINNNSLQLKLNNRQLYNFLQNQYNNDNRYFYKNDINNLFEQLKKNIENWENKRKFINSEFVKFYKRIKKEVDKYNKKIQYHHQANVEFLKQQNKKYFSMITIFPKQITSILNQKDLIIEIRKIITECVKEYSRKKKQKITYQAIPEIKLNKMNLPVHLHLHFYIYEEIDETLLKKIERRLNKLNIKYSIESTKFTIDKWTEKNNYSNTKNNIFYKIKYKGRGIYYILFTIIKLFGINRFITNSRTTPSFSKLKETMKIWVYYLRNEGMSYFQLSKKLQDEKWKKMYDEQLVQFVIWAVFLYYLFCKIYLLNL